VFSPGTAGPERKGKLLAVANRLDEHFRKVVSETNATAAVAGIVLDGELVYARGFGVRDVDSNAPVDVDTVFRIASMTKSFTAAAVMTLRDQGKVALDVPAATYLPELASLSGPTRDAPPISLRHLLTMASGLPYDDAWGAVTYGTTNEEFKNIIRSGLVLANAPSQVYAYSNLGYALLGKVVERVSGVRFREYVTANILRPLAMNSTVWESNDVLPSRLAVGYRRENGKLLAESRPSDGVFDAAGGLYTSLRDYARYVAFQLAAYPARDEPESGPLRRATLREMHQGERRIRWGEDVPVARRSADGGLWLSAANYGFGWVNNTTCASEGMVQHGGFEPGYVSTIHLLPTHGLGIAVLAASGPVGWRSIDGTLDILRAAGLLEAPSPRPSDPSLVEARDTVSRLLNKWDSALVDGTFDRLSLKYPWLASLRDDFARLSRDHGRCTPSGGVTPANRTQGKWRLRCERGDIQFEVALTPNKPSRIQNIEWKEEFPPGERLEGVARRLAGAIGRWDPAATADLFDVSLAPGTVNRTVARLAIDHGTCELDRPLSADGHGRAVFRLHCSEAPLDLSFRINEKSGRIIELSGAAPHEPGATCAQ
jgi:CubicO group peptidase (beta-lactamase class C family)